MKANNELDRLNLQDETETLNKHEDEDHQPIHRKFKKSKKTFKINMDEIKFRFLSELIYLFYFEMKNKFPDSFKV